VSRVKKILGSVAMRQHKGEWMVLLLLLMPDH
jgi:hypothetical protein